MRIPKNAKKVFEGVIFDTYQWEQKMFDGTTETFEMLKRPDTVQVICTQGDKIIIGRESQPTKEDFYTLFGGRKEENENHLESVKRELKEESGLESNNWELITKYEPYNKMEWEVHIFVARNCKKLTEQKLDAGEKIELVEITFEKFINIIIGDKFWGKEFAMDILKMKKDGKLDELKNKIFGK